MAVITGSPKRASRFRECEDEGAAQRSFGLVDSNGGYVLSGIGSGSGPDRSEFADGSPGTCTHPGSSSARTATGSCAGNRAGAYSGRYADSPCTCSRASARSGGFAGARAGREPQTCQKPPCRCGHQLCYGGRSAGIRLQCGACSQNLQAQAAQEVVDCGTCQCIVDGNLDRLQSFRQQRLKQLRDRFVAFAGGTADF